MMILGYPSSSLESAAQFVTVLLVFIFVLALTYVTTRWVARFQKQQTNNRNFEVIETHKLTSNKYLQIVRAGKKYLVIAIGKDAITMLTELTEDEVELMPEDTVPQDSFQKLLDKAKERIHKRGDN
ncbi:MAG: flagellar biosynthetic protein FliO [Lachnospiraceae bacterium]